MQTQLNRTEILQVWWAFVWRTGIVSTFFATIAGMLWGATLTATNHSDYIGFASAASGLIIYLASSYFIMRVVIRKKYPKFSISASKANEAVKSDGSNR